MDVPEPKPIREYDEVDASVLEGEIRPSRQPAVLRGIAADWPAVAAAKKSDESLVDYVKRFSSEARVAAIRGPSEIAGHFFYTDDLKDLNFQRGQTALDPFLDRLLRDRQADAPMAMAVQSEIIPKVLPGFADENGTELVNSSVAPRMWIGNRIHVAPHYDLFENLGVVVAGRRKFTLFPPDQIANLYAGPFELTPAGTPISIVNLNEPDFERFPRFADALSSAQTAELRPGDAIYIPYQWWHGVESLEPFNFFVNYWWNDTRPGLGQPYDALMYAFFALKHLPPDQRDVWRTLFDHYVFEANGDPAEHLPAHARGVLGDLTPQLLERMRMTLKQIAEGL
ncbi:cupin-like domain-containing protein [Sphingomonas daechungensis]|uniref:Cupin-like domain-containing protein n=1 Tax=Sphingomonas daechungensis TaxID=1176646 RepID=A0ABX6T3D6_9SPHN|nr:cupin-like domain-containing protein [Sphingomonas daechungensis]QNP43407.1 cupin-like domain-containing protein [Sphingomonas daechungensis]